MFHLGKFVKRSLTIGFQWKGKKKRILQFNLGMYSYYISEITWVHASQWVSKIRILKNQNVRARNSKYFE